MTHASSYDPEVLVKPIRLLSGRELTLHGLLKERPVYLKFWATWCQPCREQLPHMQRMFERYGERIHFLAVNIDVNDDADAVQATRKTLGLTIPMAMDFTGELAQAFNLVGTPYNLLLMQQGRLVHRGHESTSELDNKIGLLSSNPSTELNEVSIDSTAANEVLMKELRQDHVILFFIATWCDWYLKDSQPGVSKRCSEAQKTVNALYQSFPRHNWVGVATRLWTGESDLQDYLKKYATSHDFVIDTSNEAFFHYKVKKIPTLLILKNGVEQFRTTDFNDLKRLHSVIESIPSD